MSGYGLCQGCHVIASILFTTILINTICTDVTQEFVSETKIIASSLYGIVEAIVHANHYLVF